VKRTRVLVVDDEAALRKFLASVLGAAGYDVLAATDGEQALTVAQDEPFDLVVLDLMLPGIDGLEVCRQLREIGDMPIIVLSAKGEEIDKVDALNSGADDYLTKPFGVEELLARIRVALRHAALPPGAPPEPVFQAGDLRVDLVRREVRRGDQEVHLTPAEYKLLTLLIRHAGKVLTHRQLLKEVWGTNYADQSHYVRVYMAQLRQKLEADPARPRLLVTEPGVGYRLKTE